MKLLAKLAVLGFGYNVYACKASFESIAMFVIILAIALAVHMSQPENH